MVGPAAGWQMSINFGCRNVPWFGLAGTPEWMCLSRTLETVDRFEMACNVPATNFLAWASSAVITLELSCTRRKLSRLPRQVSKCGDDCCKKTSAHDFSSIHGSMSSSDDFSGIEDSSSRTSLTLTGCNDNSLVLFLLLCAGIHAKEASERFLCQRDRLRWFERESWFRDTSVDPKSCNQVVASAGHALYHTANTTGAVWQQTHGQLMTLGHPKYCRIWGWPCWRRTGRMSRLALHTHHRHWQTCACYEAVSLSFTR